MIPGWLLIVGTILLILIGCFITIKFGQKKDQS